MFRFRRILGLAALAGALALAAPTGGAQAASLISPGLAAAVQDAPSAKMTTEVHWRRGWHRYHRWHRHRGWHRHYGWHRRHWHRRHWY